MQNPIQGLTSPLSPKTKPNPQISNKCLEFRLIDCSHATALNNMQGKKKEHMSIQEDNTKQPFLLKMLNCWLELGRN